jgi:mRNA interferase YafQ
MKHIRRSTQFKKDYKRAKKAGKNLPELQKVIYQLAAGKPLDPSYSDHALLGNYRGCRECHLEPDWLLIYKTTEIELALVRTGSHSELF